MPLHLDSMTNDGQSEVLIEWLLTKGLDEYDRIAASADGKHLHFQRDITDTISGDLIGCVVYTLSVHEARKALQILDLDIIFHNAVPTVLRFDALQNGSSEANEYYESEIPETGQRLEIETVNRHVVKGELLGKERSVFISAFPFQVSIYDNIDALNKAAGFGTSVMHGEMNFQAVGFSERFIMPGDIFTPEEKRESYSFVVGKVVSFRDVEIVFGQTALRFVLAQVDTALGTIPTAMSREVFDLSKLETGCVVVMKADVKADVSAPGDFMESKRSMS